MNASENSTGTHIESTTERGPPEKAEYGVTVTGEFAQQLREYYPGCLTVPEALRTAASEGIENRRRSFAHDEFEAAVDAAISRIDRECHHQGRGGRGGSADGAGDSDGR